MQKREYPVLVLAPCTVSAARKQIAIWHRHLPEIQGGLFAVQALGKGGVCVAVGVAGNPARKWQGTYRIVISRVATAEIENACSMIYGALCRAAKALGYREAWTYTLEHERGTSLRAAGFTYMGLSPGGEWNVPSRQRGPAAQPGPKHRWMRKLADLKLPEPP